MTSGITANTRVAVVTGARQGIGRHIAEVLADRGWQLALIDREFPKETLDAINAVDLQTPPAERAIGIVADVSDEDVVEQAKDQILRHFGRVDALVNNAGIGMIAAAEATPADQWRRVLDVNLTGPFLLSRAFGTAMLDSGTPGAIVNVASIAALGGIPDRSAYNASKHGLLGLTRTLAVEWGARGVRVNAVCPGFVKTEMDQADLASGAYTMADIVDRVPLARFAEPDDVAEAVAYLADTNHSAYVNGIALPVDGGWTADCGWRALRLRKRTPLPPDSHAAA
ncbi:SDR family NAD(P)-dependent oxidoreductase [Streptomyces longisporoflavus]|uniref:SDR family NAD(P)-dependent oxidoreductase n=1 Tax=Streptomyces longisporoflavus TaxID=28044 RepID=A0ABW7R5N7_9ACTN